MPISNRQLKVQRSPKLINSCSCNFVNPSIHLLLFLDPRQSFQNHGLHPSKMRAPSSIFTMGCNPHLKSHKMTYQYYRAPCQDWSDPRVQYWLKPIPTNIPYKCLLIFERNPRLRISLVSGGTQNPAAFECMRSSL